MITKYDLREGDLFVLRSGLSVFGPFVYLDVGSIGRDSLRVLSQERLCDVNSRDYIIDIVQDSPYKDMSWVISAK